jgi:glycosyltransferase involved in cell wall biosynthesis
VSGPRTKPGILYVIPAYPPLASQPFVVNEMVEVTRAGHALAILPLYPGDEDPVRHGTFAALRPEAVLPARLLDPGTICLAVATLLRHPLRVLATLLALHRAAGGNPFAHARLAAVTPKALATVWRLRRLGVRHVHAHFANQTADCAAIIGRVAGLPFSFTAHAYDIYSQLPRLRNDTLAWKVRQARRVFTVSEFAARRLRRHLPEAQQARVMTAYVGIPLDVFQPAAPRPAASPMRLLCVARFCEKKGLDTLIDACAELRDRGVPFELRLHGAGPLRTALLERVRRRDLAACVELGEPIAQEVVAERLRECDVFVMPCRQDETGDMDGIPTVFMEALATARPVVSGRVSGIPELVRDGETGLLVPPDDPVAVADALARLAGDAPLRERLGRAGRLLVEAQHDQRLTARRMLALLEAALDGTETGGPGA